ADITAATTTAVSGAAEPRSTGLRRRASHSSPPLRKNTSRPRTSAGTSSSSRTSRGHTSADSRPKAPAPSAAVTAMSVALPPSAERSRKSGRRPASSSMVRVETTHTATLRPICLATRRHRTPPTPRHTSRPRPSSPTGPRNRYPPCHNGRKGRFVPARGGPGGGGPCGQSRRLVPPGGSGGFPAGGADRASAAVVAGGRHGQAAVDAGLHRRVVGGLGTAHDLHAHPAPRALGGELLDGGQGAGQHPAAGGHEQVGAGPHPLPQRAVVGPQPAHEQFPHHHE